MEDIILLGIIITINIIVEPAWRRMRVGESEEEWLSDIRMENIVCVL